MGSNHLTDVGRMWFQRLRSIGKLIYLKYYHAKQPFA